MEKSKKECEHKAEVLIEETLQGQEEPNWLLAQLAECLNDDEYDEDFLAISKYAAVKAGEIIMATGINRGTLYPNGDGGIRIEMHGKEKREMRILIGANKEDKHYIYWENPNAYGCVKLTIENVKEQFAILEGR